MKMVARILSFGSSVFFLLWKFNEALQITNVFEDQGKGVVYIPSFIINQALGFQVPNYNDDWRLKTNMGNYLKNTSKETQVQYNVNPEKLIMKTNVNNQAIEVLVPNNNEEVPKFALMPTYNEIVPNYNARVQNYLYSGDQGMNTQGAMITRSCLGCKQLVDKSEYDKAEYFKMILAALTMYDKESNFVIEVQKIEKQVVNGMKYYISFHMSSIDCVKVETCQIDTCATELLNDEVLCIECTPRVKDK